MAVAGAVSAVPRRLICECQYGRNRTVAQPNLPRSTQHTFGVKTRDGRQGHASPLDCVVVLRVALPLCFVLPSPTHAGERVERAMTCGASAHSRPSSADDIAATPPCAQAGRAAPPKPAPARHFQARHTREWETPDSVLGLPEGPASKRFRKSSRRSSVSSEAQAIPRAAERRPQRHGQSAAHMGEQHFRAAPRGRTPPRLQRAGGRRPRPLRLTGPRRDAAWKLGCGA
jgi:hypothetical protein